MKIKAVLSRGAPEALVAATNSTETASRIYEVLETNLHVEDMGPAQWYLQETDFSTPLNPNFLGCEVRLTGVSRSRRRSEMDFWDARSAIEEIYRDLIESHLPSGATMELFVSLMLDAPIRDDHGRETTIVETQAVLVQGKANVAGPPSLG